MAGIEGGGGSGTKAAGWSRGRIAVAVAAGLVALYAILGFLVAPRLIRSQIVERVGTLTGRPVGVEGVRVNPFALSVTVRGFEVKDRDGSRLASFDRLYVNAALLGLLRREVGVEALEIDRPYLHPALDARGELNVADVLRRLAASDEPPGERPPPRRVVFVVGHFRVTEAQIDFSDRSRRRPFDTTVGPVSFDLRNFRTRSDNQSPYELSGTTESGERFAWRGNVFIEPIRSNGTFSFENVNLPKYAPYYQDRTAAEIRSGRLGLKATYDLEWGVETRRVKVVDGSLTLADLVIGPQGGEPVIELPRYAITGFHSDVLTQDSEIGRMALEGGRLRMRRMPDGRIDLVELLRPPPPDAAAAPDAPRADAAPAPAKAAPASPPRAPRLRIGELSVKGVRVEAVDAVPSPEVETVLDVDRLLLQGISSDASARVSLDAAGRVDDTGRVTVKGTLLPLRPSADLDLSVEGLDLSPLTPYLAASLEARLEEAVLGLQGHLVFDGAGPVPAWTWKGDVRLDGLRMADGRHGEEFLRWRSLRLEGVDASPGRTSLRSVRLLEPVLRAITWEDKVRNLDVVLRREPAPAPSGEGDGAAPADAPRSSAAAQEKARPGAPGAAAEPASRWSIGTLQVTKGKATFVDRSTTPAATLEMSDVTLVVRGLSSDPRSSARVQADARIGGAPASVAGTLQPRFLGDATDLAIRCKGVDLTPLGPYVARFAGYELQKGKLDLDLRYVVKQRVVDGQNVARIDQFTLGEERPGPDVTSLPVKLGLAILTDKDGVIDVDVPVSGSIDDPDFSVGRMVWKAIGNVFTKLVTAPFAALGRLFGGGGGGDTLERVEFAAGSAALDPAADGTLGVLGKALRERPALRLEVEGAASEVSDGAALRKERAELEIRRAKWSALHAKQPGLVLDAVQVGPEERGRWLAAAFAAIPPVPGAAPEPGGATDAGAKGGKPSVAPEEMEAALAASVRVPPEAYLELAARRADAARDRLLAGGDLDAARVFVATGGERARKEGGSRAYFELK